MSYLMSVNPSPLRVMRQRLNEPVHSNLRQPTILVATVDPAISANMRDLLNMYPVKTIWAKGVDEVRSALAVENVAACFCGFWLVDGTYRDVVRHLKNQPVEIPAIIVCAPACPNEYRDYLAALNIRAFDVICYPYRKTDMERILRAATSERNMFGRLQESDAISSSVVERHSDLRKAG